MVKRIPVGHWGCVCCGAEFQTKPQAEDHEENCEYRYDRYE